MDYSIFNSLKPPFTITVEEVMRTVSVEIVTRKVTLD
jgi:hypothetical protein